VFFAAETRTGGWTAQRAQSQLVTGLHGHAVAAHDDIIFIWGGQLDESGARYISPGVEPLPRMMS